MENVRLGHVNIRMIFEHLLEKNPEIQLQDGWHLLAPPHRAELWSQSEGVLGAVHPTVRHPDTLTGSTRPPSASADLKPRDTRGPGLTAVPTPDAACPRPGSRPVAGPGGEAGAWSSAFLTRSHSALVRGHEDF